jgi:hypothetical protein
MTDPPWHLIGTASARPRARPERWCHRRTRSLVTRDVTAVCDFEAALPSAASGLKAVDKTEGAPGETELHRLKGEALLAGAGTVSEAEAANRRALARALDPATKRPRVRAVSAG